jgi:hypothetical protein
VLAEANTPRRARKIGDKVTVIASAQIRFSPGVRNKWGTKKLFNGMVGKVYTARGFDEYGHLELRPKRASYVWIEPEFPKLRPSKKAAATFMTISIRFQGDGPETAVRA